MNADLKVAPPTIRSAAELDAIDRALIAELHRDGRMTTEELSRRVALSRPAVVARLKHLHETGAIRGYAAIPDWERLGFPILAYVHVRTSGKCRDVAQHITRAYVEGLRVEECHRTTGEWCLLVKIRATASSAVETFLDGLIDGGNVQATMTMLALSTT